MDTTLLSRWEGGRLSSTVQPMRDGHNSANEKPLPFTFPVYLNGLDVYNRACELPISSIKEQSSFVLACLRLLVPVCNSLLFPDKPIFAGKMTGSLFFRLRAIQGMGTEA